MKPSSSKVWVHFKKKSSDTAECRHCQQSLKTCGNTTNLNAHLKRKHPLLLKNPVVSLSQPQRSVELDEEVDDEPREKRKKKPDQTISSAQTQSTSSSRVEASQVSQELQHTIYGAFKRVESLKRGGESANKITQDILYMICKDCEPFQIVERKGFRKLLKTLAPQYKVPDRKTLKTYIEDKYEALALVMKEKLTDKTVTLTTDIWTDLQMRSYLSLTVHYYDEPSCKMMSHSLTAIQLEENHTGDYIGDQLLKMCEQWGIKAENVLAVVTDNAGNMKKAVDKAFGSAKHIPCFAHTLNLVVEKAIEECSAVSSLISSVKDIVSWFKRSVVASDALRRKTDKKLIQSVPTRWNSVYLMLERFIQLRPVINEIMSNHTTAPNMVTAVEFSVLKEVVEVLEPFMSATETISGECYGTSSLVIPIVSIIKSKMEASCLEAEPAKLLQKKLQEQLKKRFEHVEQVRYLGLATILDPRFKKMYFRDQTACANTILRINSMVREAQDTSKTGEDSSPDRSSGSESDHGNKRKCIFMDHNKQIQHRFARDAEASKKGKLVNELSLYLNAPIEKIQEDPLHYWRSMQDTYPSLAQIARKCLSTVSTSVPSERLFSKAGKTVSQSRNRLSGKLVSKLLFLQNVGDDLW